MKNKTLNYFNSNSYHRNYILSVKRILIVLISFILIYCSEKQIYNKTKFEITYPEKFQQLLDIYGDIPEIEDYLKPRMEESHGQKY